MNGLEEVYCMYTTKLTEHKVVLFRGHGHHVIIHHAVSPLYQLIQIQPWGAL